MDKLVKLVKISFMAGLAMFSMFFGSGNLVFPIQLGISNSLSYEPAFSGLIITGVVLPFIGLYGIVIYKGYSGKYFNYIGRSLSQLLIFLMLALLGPLGVIPRCVTVATGGMRLILPEIPEYVFGLFFILTIYYILSTKVSIVQVLGKFLGPILLLGLLAIIVAGYIAGPSLQEPFVPNSNLESFRDGILKGYHTMDLMAAFFFGVSISIYLNKKISDHSLDTQEIHIIAIVSSVIGAVMLALIYIGFVYLGAKYSDDLRATAPQMSIVHLAEITLGGAAKPITAITIFMACFTSAIVLTQIFCKYIEDTLLQRKTRLALQGTVLTSFIISSFGFEVINIYLTKILGIMYPGLITIAITNLVIKDKPVAKKYIFWAAVLSTIIITLCA